MFLTQESQEPGQDGFLVFLRDGEVDAPDSAGLRFVSHQGVDGHKEGFCVKVVERVLTVKHAALFFLILAG